MKGVFRTYDGPQTARLLFSLSSAIFQGMANHAKMNEMHKDLATRIKLQNIRVHEPGHEQDKHSIAMFRDHDLIISEYSALSEIELYH